MQKNKFNIVTDAQWGSTGKGAIATALAYKHRPEILSTTNMANAGHCCVNIDDQKFVAKALPSPTMLAKWYPEYQPAILVGPSAAFDIAQMHKEIIECGVEHLVHIHPRAGVILEKHKLLECDMTDGTKHIASTMQGCGAFLAEKIMRKNDVQLARDYPELNAYVCKLSKITAKFGLSEELSFPLALKFLLQNGVTALHEGSQGFSLDINHGSHYPQCTSRGTTAIQNLADMGVGPALVGDIYIVLRPYPIRVGNVVENGKTLGYSGDCYPDCEETTWAEVAKAAGAPPEVTAGELTTVTKRLRRVFTFSKMQLKEAVVANGATKMALNFANYIDWSCHGMNDYSKLPPKVKAFINEIEDIAGIPVTIIGTGARIDQVCYLE